jgi:hypothetical protein
MSSPDIQQLVVNRLQEESCLLLKELNDDQPGANGGFYHWFQNTIAKAEAGGKDARAMAAVVLMHAYAEELSSHSFDENRLQSRIHQGIDDLVAGR